jgi:hypothetical protein
MSVDKDHAQWTSKNLDNLQRWFDDAKMDLIQTGLVVDSSEVGDHADGISISELDFRSDDIRHHVISMDETHHNFFITGARRSFGPNKSCSVVQSFPSMRKKQA